MNYQKLPKGELIQKGDEFFYCGHWIPCYSCIGYRVGDEVMKEVSVRRPSKRVFAPTYRRLRKGEIIRKGDQFIGVNDNSWVPCIRTVGEKTGNRQMRGLIVRRPLKK